MRTFYNVTQLKAALSRLHEATRSLDCQVPRVDAAQQQESPTGVSYGTHGAAFAQIDPASLEVRCGACAGEIDATVKSKTRVRVRGDKTGRVHLVTEVQDHHEIADEANA